MIKFIHTADWHLGRPFHSVEGTGQRHRLQQARIDAVKNIGVLAEKESASFILVAGDLFDSPTPTRETVAEALAAIGALGLPVHAIPGNHDHGGPAGPWGNDHLIREREHLAPNLTVHEDGVPVEVEGVTLLPAPLRRRHERTDPTLWIRNVPFAELDSDRPRVVLAHGSVTSFSSPTDGDDPLSGAPNLISLEHLPMEELDYVALGDWHGTFQVNGRAWYSGTPEPDRFPKGTAYQSGNVLVVTVQRGELPDVRPEKAGNIQWREAELSTSSDTELEDLLSDIDALTGPRVQKDVLRLRVSGVLGFSARERLEDRLEDFRARLLMADIDLSGLHLRPTDEELAELQDRAGDPVLSSVAQALLRDLEGGNDPTVALALQRLYTFVNEEA